MYFCLFLVIFSLLNPLQLFPPPPLTVCRNLLNHRNLSRHGFMDSITRFIPNIKFVFNYLLTNNVLLLGCSSTSSDRSGKETRVAKRKTKTEETAFPKKGSEGWGQIIHIYIWSQFGVRIVGSFRTKGKINLLQLLNVFDKIRIYLQREKELLHGFLN